MPQIKMRRKHAKSEQEVKALVNQLADGLQQKYKVNATWQGDTLAFREKGISGDLSVRPGEIEIIVKTGLLMAPLTKTIESELNKALDKHLA